MSTWPASWESLTSTAFLHELFPLPHSPFLTLPTELIQHIAIIGFSGDPCSTSTTLSEIITLFTSLARVCSATRAALRSDWFLEMYFKEVFPRRLGLGRPADLNEAGWRWTGLGRRVMREAGVLECGTQVEMSETLGRPKVEQLVPPRELEREWGRRLFRPDKLGGLANVWEPAVFDAVLDEDSVQGKLISHHSPIGPLSDPDLFPLLVTLATRRPKQSDTYPSPRDISVGMTFFSVPAMKKITFFVNLGNVDLGVRVVENEEGVTWRDVDYALDEFLEQPFTLTHRSHIKRYLPDFSLAKLNLPSPTIRQAISGFTHPIPSILPGIMSGKTGAVFMTKWSDEVEGIHAHVHAEWGSLDALCEIPVGERWVG